MSRTSISGAIGDWGVAQAQSFRRRDCRPWPWIALPREDVDSDIDRMDAFGHRLQARRLNSDQSVHENCREDFDHLPVAIVGSGEFAGGVVNSPLRP